MLSEVFLSSGVPLPEKVELILSKVPSPADKVKGTGKKQISGSQHHFLE